MDSSPLVERNRAFGQRMRQVRYVACCCCCCSGRVWTWIFLGLAVLVLVPAVLVYMLKNDIASSEILMVVSSLFVFMAIPLSLHDIFQHLTNYWQPVLQQYVVRVLWMVPIYAITSWLALLLWVLDQEQYTYVPTSLRTCYEAYTVYNFFAYLLAFLETYHGVSVTEVLMRSVHRRHYHRPRNIDGGDDEEEGAGAAGSDISFVSPLSDGSGGGGGGVILVPHLPPVRVVVPWPPSAFCAWALARARCWAAEWGHRGEGRGGGSAAVGDEGRGVALGGVGDDSHRGTGDARRRQRERVMVAIFGRRRRHSRHSRHSRPGGDNHVTTDTLDDGGGDGSGSSDMRGAVKILDLKETRKDTQRGGASGAYVTLSTMSPGGGGGGAKSGSGMTKEQEKPHADSGADHAHKSPPPVPPPSAAPLSQNPQRVPPPCPAGIEVRPFGTVGPQDWDLPSGEFVRKCRFGVLVYVATMPALAVLEVFLSLLGVYDESELFSFGGGFAAWNTLMCLVLSSYAVYCLVLFYHEASLDLAATRPLVKFLVVKGIVFFTFVQNLVLAFYFKIVRGGDAVGSYSADRAVGALTNFVMCVEMFFFALAHHAAFSHQQFPRVTAATMSSEGQRVLVEWGHFYGRSLQLPPAETPAAGGDDSGDDSGGSDDSIGGPGAHSRTLDHQDAHFAAVGQCSGPRLAGARTAESPLRGDAGLGSQQGGQARYVPPSSLDVMHGASEVDGDEQPPPPPSSCSSSPPSSSPPPVDASSTSSKRNCLHQTTNNKPAAQDRSGRGGPRAGYVLGGLDAMLDVSDVHRETRLAWREIGRGTREVATSVRSTTVHAKNATATAFRRIIQPGSSNGGAGGGGGDGSGVSRGEEDEVEQQQEQKDGSGKDSGGEGKT